MRKYLLLISASILALDLLSKSVIKERIPLYGDVDVIPGLFRLTHLENPGAAFSLFADSSGPWIGRLLILFSILALAVISFLLWRHGRTFDTTALALALFLGGTLGNLCDRLVRGRVTDFLDFYIGTHHWPPFNVADSAIVLGALLLAGRVFVVRAESEGKQS
jgi:signal peptidase II